MPTRLVKKIKIYNRVLEKKWNYQNTYTLLVYSKLDNHFALTTLENSLAFLSGKGDGALSL